MTNKKGVKKILLKQKATSALEYIAIMILVMACILLFERYIARGFFGQWKKAGDIFGHGRQYDPRVFGLGGDQGGTLECYCERNHTSVLRSGPTWIPTRCADANCDCTLPPEHPDYPVECVACLDTCVGLGTNLCGNDPC
jgi:hypothetical protein